MGNGLGVYILGSYSYLGINIYIDWDVFLC